MANENLELEEKQVKEYNDILTNYSFTVEGGGVPLVEGPKLEIKKAGIRLHFSRYGLFHNSTKGNSETKPLVTAYHQGKKSETIEEEHPTGAPRLEGFYYAKTYLNAGYVYIMDEGDANLWYEFEVDELGSFSPIYWEKNKDAEGNYKDIRRSEGKVLSYKTFKQGAVLWIAYSPVQWSIDYHTLIRTNTQKRTERMVKVVCSGFEQGAGSTENFVTPFNEMNGVFSLEQNHQSLWFEYKLQEIIADDKSSKKKDPQALKEDMFITLHDPIGTINEACGKYSEEFLKFKALCEAIQTGETVDEAFERLVLDQEFSATKNQDHQYLFALANFSYHHVYGSKSNVEEYSDTIELTDVKKYLGDDYVDISYVNRQKQENSPTSVYAGGTDFKKLLGILGVDERKEVCDQLISFRKIVFDFFKSEYPFKYAEDYLYNTSIKTLTGRFEFNELMEVLYINPHDVDANLRLAKDRVSKDKIKEKFEKLIVDKKSPSGFQLTTKSEAPNFKGENLLVALSSSLLNVEVPDKCNKQFIENISMKSAAIMKVGVSVIASRAFSTIKSNSGTYKGVNLNSKLSRVQKEIVIQFNKGLLINSQELLALNKNGIILSFQDQYVMAYTDGSSALKLDIISQNPGDNKVTSLTGEKMSSNEIRANKFNNKLAKIVNSNHFITTMGILATYNLLKTVGQLNQNDTWRNKINLGSSIANVAEVALSINEKYAKLYKIPKLEYKLQTAARKSVENLTKKAGAIGSVLTCGVCIMDSLELFAEDDNDSGIAMLAAGVGFAISGIAPIYLSAALGGPVAWGALILATGLYILSEALKDDDFQKIYKHYLLSDYATCSKNGENPMVYAQKILSQKQALTHPDYRITRTEVNKPDLENPRSAYLKLMEEAIMPSIKVKGLSKQSSADNILWGWYNSFNIAIPFNNYLNSEEDVNNAEVSALLYSQHSKSYGNSRKDNISFTKQRKENVLLVKIYIDKYTSYISEKAYCDVFIRLGNIPDSDYFFPFSNEKGEQRIIKIRLKLNYDVRRKNPIQGAYSIVPIQ